MSSSKKPTHPPPGESPALLRHVEAVGGVNRIRHLRSLRRTGVLKGGGLEGHITVLYEAPDCFREEVRLGPYEQVLATDGRTYWKSGPGGQALEVEGEERKEFITACWLQTYRYLLLPEYLREQAKGAFQGKSYPVLEVIPLAGVPCCLWLDPKTYQVHHSVLEASGGETSIFHEAHSTTEGLVFPARLRQSTGDPQYDMEIVFEKTEVNLALDPAVFRKPAPAVLADAEVAGPASVKLERLRDLLLVPANLDGQGPFTFVLDTGAGMTCLDVSAARSLGYDPEGALEGRGVGGSQPVGLVKLHEIRIGDISLPNEVVATMPFADLVRRVGRPFHGIVGFNFFSRFAVTLDYPENILTVHPAGAAVEGGENLPLSLDQNLPHVPVVLNDKTECVFALDTGMTGSADLEEGFAKELGLFEAGRRVLRRRGFGVGGKADLAVGRLHSLSLGRFRIPEPVYTVALGGRFPRGGSCRGILGGGILRRFVVHLDYAEKRCVIWPGPYVAEREPYDQAGLSFLTDGLRLLVDFVLRGSPAEEAGIRVGDEILALDGSPISANDLVEILDHFQRPDHRQCSLTVGRAGQLLDLSIALRELV